jgi:catechol 2,3-dioxygenase-like lactoylglutathione lyase family enzyme
MGEQAEHRGETPMRDAQHDRETVETSSVRRRMLLGVLGAGASAAILPLARALGQARALPLKNLGLEHLDIVVPDTAESARFYKRVFSSPLHEQDFRGGKRYFVLLGGLPPDRQVGYIAIGAANGRPTTVGHYCALAESADIAAIGKELAAAGYPEPGGGFGMIPDPDGLELQLFEPPAGLVTAAVPSTLEVTDDGALAPLGLEHVLLAVSDLESALRYYRFVYGEDLETRRRSQSRLVPPRARYTNRPRAGRPRREAPLREFRHQGGAVRRRSGRGSFAGSRRRDPVDGALVGPLSRQLRHHAGGDRKLAGRRGERDGSAAVARGCERSRVGVHRSFPAR